MLKSTGVVGVLTLLSRVLGFVRDVLLARAFGAGGGMDAFLVALMIPNFGRRVFAEGAFSQAFVPVFTEVKLREDHERLRQMVAVTMGTLGGVLALITLLGCLAAPVLVLMFASGFASDPGQAALASELLRWTFPYLMFISLTAMAGAVLNAHGRFAIPAVTPVILNLCLIASALIDESSVRVLAYAVFAAGVLQFLFQLPSLAALKLLPKPRFAWGDVRVQRVLGLMLPVMLGSATAQLSLLINSNLATHLGDGSVSWLYFADRLMEFPLGIFSIALATVILPALSAQHSRNAPTEFGATLDWGLRLLCLIGIPAALSLILLAGPLVTTLFGYGRFGENDIHMTEYALWGYGAGFMGFSLVKLLVPGFYARQEMRLPVRYGIIALGSGMALSIGLFAWAKLSGFAAGHVGLAIATSFTAWLNAGLLWRRLKADGVWRSTPGWGAFLLRLLLANAVMSVVVLWIAGPTANWIAADLADRAGRLTLVISVGVLSYFATLALAGLRPRHLQRSV